MTKENKRMVVMGGSFNPPTRGVGTSNSSLFCETNEWLGKHAPDFGKHAPDFGLLFCIWNRQNMHKKLRVSTCFPDTCPLYS